MDGLEQIKEKNEYTSKDLRKMKNKKKEIHKQNVRKNIDDIDMSKICVKFGKEKAELIKEEFLRIRKKLEEKLRVKISDGSGFGTEFEVFAIAVLHNMDYQMVIDNHIVHGSDDGTVDAIVWDKDHVNVYQIKLGTIKSSEKSKIEKNISEFMYNPEIKKLSSNNTKDLLRFLKNNKKDIIKKEFQIFAISTNSSGDDYKTNDIFKKYFRQIVLPMVENNLELFLPIPIRNINDKSYVSNVSLIENKIYIFTINAKELKHRITEILGISKGDKIYKLFYDNVRGSLGKNQSLAKTITDKNERKYFIDYNNGVTITGDVKYIERSGIRIKNPVVSNGQQTLTNIMSVKEDDILEEIDVIILVKDTTKELHLEQKKLKQKIAKHTNTQTAIKPIDLLSLDANVRDIQEFIYSKGENQLNSFNKVDGFFLDIYSNGKKEYDEIVKKIYSKKKIIDLSTFIRLYSSLQNSNNLGNWKSSISSMIDKNYTSNHDVPAFDKKLALKVCQAIYEYKTILDYIYDKDRNDLKSADLAYQYLMVEYNLTSIECFKRILMINNEFYYSLPEAERPSKLIDIYKSNTVIDKIDKVMKEQTNIDLLSINIKNYKLIDDNYYNFIFYIQENASLMEAQKMDPQKIANVIYSFSSVYSEELCIGDTNLFLMSFNEIQEVENKLNKYCKLSSRKKVTLSNSLDLYKKYLSITSI